MLFLAVFCGFFAEYQLEHKIERERGRHYVFSFYEDLKADTANYATIIRSYQEKLIALKDRHTCFESINQNTPFDSCLSHLFLNSMIFNDFVYTERTLQQLKNAGGLRLLKDEDADSILVYDNLLQLHLRAETTGFQQGQNKIRELVQSLMDYKSMSATGNNIGVLYETDKKTINYYFVLLEWYARFSQLNMESVIQIKAKATDLIEFFKKKYRLK